MGAWPGRVPANGVFTTDGGTAQAPDGVVRTAKLLRAYLQRRDTTVSGQQRRGFVTIARSTRRARLAYGRAYWCRRREDDFGEPTRSFETSSSRFWTARARSVAGSMKWQAKQEKQKKVG
jgi:hypothetical protein